MNVVIVNCFETYNERVQLVYDFFEAEGEKVTVIQSNFKHLKKETINEKKDNYIFIKTLPYFKNLSMERLISHYKFSKDAFKVVEKLSPDLLYVVLPGNSSAKFAAKYKKENNQVKLIFDIMDLWPETFPVKKNKFFFPFKIWQNLRDKNLKYSDYVITECNLFKDKLQKVLYDTPIKTVYLAKKNIKVNSQNLLSNDEIHLAYLGSINNIIDIEKITDIISKIVDVYAVTLHIIGDGENRDKFITSSENVGAKVIYYGKIYDSQSKQDIFDKCDFGLNIMKSTVCVGLTMKSIDYFQHGLPILNNIQYDTKSIVRKYEVGINLNTPNNLSEFTNNLRMIKQQDYRRGMDKLFIENFSLIKFNDSLSTIFKGINDR